MKPRTTRSRPGESDARATPVDPTQALGLEACRANDPAADDDSAPRFSLFGWGDARPVTVSCTLALWWLATITIVSAAMVSVAPNPVPTPGKLVFEFQVPLWMHALAWAGVATLWLDDFRASWRVWARWPAPGRPQAGVFRETAWALLISAALAGLGPTIWAARVALASPTPTGGEPAVDTLAIALAPLATVSCAAAGWVVLNLLWHGALGPVRRTLGGVLGLIVFGTLLWHLEDLLEAASHRWPVALGAVLALPLTLLALQHGLQRRVCTGRPGLEALAGSAAPRVAQATALRFLAPLHWSHQRWPSVKGGVREGSSVALGFLAATWLHAEGRWASRSGNGTVETAFVTPLDTLVFCLFVALAMGALRSRMARPRLALAPGPVSRPLWGWHTLASSFLLCLPWAPLSLLFSSAFLVGDHRTALTLDEGYWGGVVQTLPCVAAELLLAFAVALWLRTVPTGARWLGVCVLWTLTALLLGWTVGSPFPSAEEELWPRNGWHALGVLLLAWGVGHFANRAWAKLDIAALQRLGGRHS